MRRKLVLVDWQHANVFLATSLKLDIARRGGINRVISAQANVPSQTVLGSMLANDDASCVYPLASISLHP